jgi:hypothetical protein
MVPTEETLTYESILRVHARKSMLWASLLGSIGLGIISLGSASTDWISGLVYLPLMLVMLTTLIALMTTTDSRRQLFRYLSDLFGFCAILGATALVIRADMIGFTLKTSPIQYALLLSFPLCFHRRSIGMIRNSALTLTSALCLTIYSVDLTQNLFLHYIFGFFAGSIVHFISEDRMYKDFLYKRTIERERIDSSRRMRHLHAELRSRCLPHQIELIYNGHHYRETMPVYRANFWVSCLNLVLNPSEKTLDSEHRQRFQNISDRLRERYQSDFSPTNQPRLAKTAKNQESTPGFYVRCDDNNFFVSYDYPFPIDSQMPKTALILRSLIKQLQTFRDVVAEHNEFDLVSATIALTYGHGTGSFTGSLSNYEIEGPVFFLAERYQKTRFQIKTINEKIKDGYLTIIMSQAAYQRIRREIGKGFVDQFEEYRAHPHVRDDKEGRFVYAWFIEHQRLDQIIHELRQFKPQTQLQLVA